MAKDKDGEAITPIGMSDTETDTEIEIKMSLWTYFMTKSGCRAVIGSHSDTVISELDAKLLIAQFRDENIAHITSVDDGVAFLQGKSLKSIKEQLDDPLRKKEYEIMLNGAQLTPPPRKERALAKGRKATASVDFDKLSLPSKKKMKQKIKMEQVRMMTPPPPERSPTEHSGLITPYDSDMLDVDDSLFEDYVMDGHLATTLSDGRTSEKAASRRFEKPPSLPYENSEYFSETESLYSRRISYPMPSDLRRQSDTSDFYKRTATDRTTKRLSLDFSDIQEESTTVYNDASLNSRTRSQLPP